MRSARVLSILLVLGARLASAVICPGGELASNQTATGLSAEQLIDGDHARAIAVAYHLTTGGGSSATVEVNLCCPSSENDCSVATGRWVAVAGSSVALTGGATDAGAVGIDNPTCLYRTRVTAIAGGGNVDTTVRCTAPGQ